MVYENPLPAHFVEGDTSGVPVLDDGSGTSLSELVTAVLAASRALVGVAARSLVGVEDDVTLAQFRALVLMATKGPQTAGTLASDLAIHPSTATRLFDRLERKELIVRAVSADNRREVTIELAPAGRQLVEEVTAIRREHIRRILAGVAPADRGRLVEGFRAFAAAADETTDRAWMLGWQ